MVNIDDFNLSLLSIRNCSVEDSETINSGYVFWGKIWKEELASINSEVPNWANEFYRHDYLLLLKYQNIPVGLHLYGCQNLLIKACIEQSYFDSFGNNFIQGLLGDKIEKVFSASWLSVNPEYAKLDKNIIFSKVILALALKVCTLYGRQGIIGPTRRDNGMAQKALEWGGISYGEKMVHNVPCNLIFVPAEVQYPLSEEENNLIQSIWHRENRHLKLVA